ncbi:MAG: holo-ACP synthase [Proteobacteria bacterium]|nr:holo-ACP synthase [Pseudomonadota bacterium]
MIVGIGIDIVEIGRIRQANERWGDNFTSRILSPPELAALKGKRDIHPHISARFAAKEAFLKALGTGLARGISWHDMEVKREKGHRPFFSISGQAHKIMTEMGVKKIHLSMSHERQYAIAQVILED